MINTFYLSIYLSIIIYMIKYSLSVYHFFFYFLILFTMLVALKFFLVDTFFKLGSSSSLDTPPLAIESVSF